MTGLLQNQLTAILTKENVTESFGFSLRRAIKDGKDFEVTPNFPTLHQLIQVEQDGLAYKALLRNGDLILEINDHDVRSKSYVECVKLLKAAGNQLKLKVISFSREILVSKPIVQSEPNLPDNVLACRSSLGRCVMKNQTEIKIDIPTFLTRDYCIHSTRIEEYDKLTQQCLEILRAYCSSPDGLLDMIFYTIVDEPLTTDMILRNINQGKSLADMLTPYVVDSLKRYHSLHDVMTILSEVFELQITDTAKQIFEILSDQMTKRLLLVQALENVSDDTQRFMANFIRKNDLPIPFSYKIWNTNKKSMEYRVNFNCLMEPLCLTDLHLMLQFGSPSTRGLGKTSLIGYWFNDKPQESLFTDVIDSTWRNGCIDVVFAEQFTVFDTHGVTTDIKSMRSIQPYADVQVIYVTEEDCGGDFLQNIVADTVSIIDTIVVIFTPHYDSKSESKRVIEHFQSAYPHWTNVRWTSAPYMNMHSNLSRQKIIQRNEHLRKNFQELLSQIKSQTRRSLFRSSFQIQSSFYSENTDFIAVRINFEVEDEFHRLFSTLSDKTMNLSIVAPAHHQRFGKSSNDSTVSKTHAALLPSTLNEYHTFTINLLTRRTYIELLIVEKCLEDWRNTYVPDLRTKQLSLCENASTLLRQWRMAEAENSKSAQVTQLHERYELARNDLQQLDEQLMNVDLTIGLLCDELFAVWDLMQSTQSYDRINKLSGDFDLVATKLVELVNKGFALHILRGRPLQSHSRLLRMCLEKIQFREHMRILTVIGEQSSAKSSLLNSTFGCNFHVSSGRCTIGVYLGIVHYKNMTIVILDTEGLLSLEESDSNFDNQMVTMAVLSSNVVIINHKGEISSNLEGLIGMSLYAKIQIQTSPFKPKLLFALRDQAQRNKTTIFQQQLNRLKDNIQIKGQPYIMSLDDEIEMKQIALLPSAYTEDLNRDYNIVQKWRTETFATEIMKFRSTTIKSLEEYLNEVSTQEQNSLMTTNSSRNSSRKMGRYLYTKLTTNWKSIDDLGERLLTCQSLYDLSIQNELKSLATNIITEQQELLQTNGNKLIQELVLNHNDHNTIQSQTNDDLKPDVWVSQCRDIGERKLKELVDAHIALAENDYDEISKHSLYGRVKSQRNYIKGSIKNMGLYLNEQLEIHAWETILKVRHDFYRRELMRVKSNSTTIDEFIKQSNERVEKLEDEIRDSLQKYQRSRIDISKTVLSVYNNLIGMKSSKRLSRNINVCNEITHEEFVNTAQKLNDILNNYRRIFAESSDGGNLTFLNDRSSLDLEEALVSSRFPIASNIDQIVSWLLRISDPKKIEQIIKFIFDDLLHRINDQLNTAPMHLAYSDPRNLNKIIEMIDNELNGAKMDMRGIDRPAFMKSIMILTIHTIVEKTIRKFEQRQQELFNETLKDLKRVQENVIELMREDGSLFSEAQIFRRSLGRAIISEVLQHSRRKFVEQWSLRCLQNYGIDSTEITHQIYAESITSKKIDPDAILKLVIDPNHYCAENVFDLVQLIRRSLVQSYLNDAQCQITSWMLIMTDTVLNDDCQDAEKLCQQITRQIAAVFPEFRGPNAIEVERKIKNPKKFKEFFETMNFFDDETDHVLAEELKKIPNKFNELIKRTSETYIYQAVGCTARCPGCGIKCELPSQVNDEDHHHSNRDHLPMAFNGWPKNRDLYPHLSMCYQQWRNEVLYRDDDSLSTPEEFFSIEAPDWYQDLKVKSETGVAHAEIYPLPEQRRAWMAVRWKLMSDFGLKDQDRYHKGIYPTDIRSIPADYELFWQPI